MNQSPIDQLKELATVSDSLKGALGNVFGGQNDEYSSGRLRWEEIQNDRLAISEKARWEMEDKKARRDFWKHMPAGVGAAAQQLVGALGSMGFGPINYVTPEADAAADQALQGMGA